MILTWNAFGIDFGSILGSISEVWTALRDCKKLGNLYPEMLRISGYDFLGFSTHQFGLQVAFFNGFRGHPGSLWEALWGHVGVQLGNFVLIFGISVASE